MTNHAVSNRADLRERTKTMSRHGDRRGQIADFRDSFETINCLYLLFRCGIKTKTHFEWLLWHWSSLGQLNLEPTRPSGLVGCKVLTDLVKISVKEATHMGFYYSIPLTRCNTLHYIINWCHTHCTYCILIAHINPRTSIVITYYNYHVCMWMNMCGSAEVCDRMCVCVWPQLRGFAAVLITQNWDSI